MGSQETSLGLNNDFPTEGDNGNEFYFMSSGEVVELCDGAIVSIIGQDGELIEAPTPPRRLKSSSVASHFKVAQHSVNFKAQSGSSPETQSGS